MTIPRISIVMIGKNEERTLPRCLKSLEQFKARGGDMVFVDTGSIDNTAKIAEDFGMRTFKEGNKFIITITKEQADKINSLFVAEGELPIVTEGMEIFDFAEARNYATSWANNDYIISLDCDEVLETFNIDEMEKIFNEGYNQVLCSYSWSRLPKSEIISYRNAFNRLHMYWSGYVHENLIAVDNFAISPIAPSNIFKISHYPIRNQNRRHYLPTLGFQIWQCKMNIDFTDCFNNHQLKHLIRELINSKRFKSAEMVKEKYLHELKSQQNKVTD